MADLGGCVAVRLEIIADAWPWSVSVDGDAIGDLEPGGCQRLSYIRRAARVASIVPRHVQNDADRRKCGQTRNGRRRCGFRRRDPASPAAARRLFGQDGLLLLPPRRRRRGRLMLLFGSSLGAGVSPGRASAPPRSPMLLGRLRRPGAGRAFAPPRPGWGRAAACCGSGAVRARRGPPCFAFRRVRRGARAAAACCSAAVRASARAPHARCCGCLLRVGAVRRQAARACVLRGLPHAARSPPLACRTASVSSSVFKTRETTSGR